ncbi:9174_t:CDS:2, partial [Racocetra persica]
KWGECQKLSDKTGRIFIYINKLLNGKDYTSKIMTKGLTENIINHLAVMHQIFKNMLLPTRSTNQDESFMTMTKERQKYLEQLLYEWFILETLSLYILESPSFQYFINKSILAFNIPNCKKFKRKIFESKNYVSLKISELLEHEASWFKEVTLMIKNLPHPYIGDHIQEALEIVITKWKLNNKVFCYTTNNSTNMKKALNQISWLKRVLCTVHTIQLVVEKGMLPAKVLIARA